MSAHTRIYLAIITIVPLSAIPLTAMIISDWMTEEPRRVRWASEMLAIELDQGDR